MTDNSDYREKMKELAKQRRRELYLKAKARMLEKKAEVKKRPLTAEEKAKKEQLKERQRAARRAAYQKKKEALRREQQKLQPTGDKTAKFSDLKLVQFNEETQEFTALKKPPASLKLILGGQGKEP